MKDVQCLLVAFFSTACTMYVCVCVFSCVRPLLEDEEEEEDGMEELIKEDTLVIDSEEEEEEEQEDVQSLHNLSASNVDKYSRYSLS